MFQPTGSKRIFTVFLHRHTPEEFDEYWQEQSKRGAPMSPNTEKEFVDAYKKSLPEIYEATHPHIHRFNDIFGFAEIWWERGHDFVVRYYLRGDSRTKVGRKIAGRYFYPISSRQFYEFREVKITGFFKSSASELKRKVLVDTLEDISTTAREEFGCFVDLLNEYEIASCLDMDVLIPPNS